MVIVTDRENNSNVVVVVRENNRNVVVVYSFTIQGWYHYKYIVLKRKEDVGSTWVGSIRDRCRVDEG